MVEVVQLPMLQEALGHCKVTGQRAQNHAGKPIELSYSKNQKRKTKRRVRVRVRVRAHGPKSTKHAGKPSRKRKTKGRELQKMAVG